MSVDSLTSVTETGETDVGSGLPPTTVPSSLADSGPRRSGVTHRLRRVLVRWELRLALVPVVAAVLWSVSLINKDPRTMADLGLLDLLSVGSVVALVLIAVGMLLSLHWNAPEWLLGLHLVTYIALIHGTPAVLYGTLRYSWSYKHVGIVDYILRHGQVDPTIAVGSIYHNWPGFFAGSALLTSAAGQSNALQIATWAPLGFNLMNLILLRYLFRGLTNNKRLIWLGLWMFFIINWVGQDYFSPQAMAYVLYLGCIGLLVRRSVTGPVLAAFVAVVAVVAASHQITPMMLVLAVSAMVVLRRTPGWYLPVLAAAVTVAWAFTAARSYTVPNVYDLVAGLGQPVANASASFDQATITGSQVLVVWGGRSVVLIATLVALWGVWRSWRGRGLRVTAILLMVLPGALVVVTGFGGEVLFRAFLFAAPFLAFLAAAGCLPRDGRGYPIRHLVATVVVTALLLPGFLLAYYGKERQNYFTPAEVQAATWIDDNAPLGSLLVEGSRNYPAQFLNYERFTYVPIDQEDEDSWKPLLADPAGGLREWADNPRYAATYVLITRSQKNAVDSARSLPPGSLDVIENALRRSPDFRVVFDNPDATVFTPSVGTP